MAQLVVKDIVDAKFAELYAAVKVDACFVQSVLMCPFSKQKKKKKNLVSFFRNSSLNSAALQRAQGEKALCMITSCATRWNSVIEMFSRCLRLLPAIAALQSAISNEKEEALPGFVDVCLSPQLLERLRIAKKVCTLCVVSLTPLDIRPPWGPYRPPTALANLAS